MDVVILLADSAQVDQSGKLHALGIGWDQTTSPTAPAGLIVLVKVPWVQTNQRHHLTVQLLDADGRPVALSTPLGDQPVQLEADFEAGRPPGMTAGAEQMMKLALPLGPMPLAPGRYEWRAEIDDRSDPSWSAAFNVGAPAQSN